MRATLKKAERLTGKKRLAEIHKHGKAVKSYPFVLLYLACAFDSSVPARLAISVPSRRVRSAVGRNAIKRQVREAYRNHKETLYNTLQAQELQMGMLLIFVGEDKRLDTEWVNRKISTLLKRLQRELEGEKIESKRDEKNG